ncbi:alpha/beta hydrolase, partial [Cronobacter muytjensii]
MTPIRLSRLAAALALAASTTLHAADEPMYGRELEGFAYPAPVRQFNFSSQGVKLHMAYMDIAPQGKANGRTVVLLHGKNFCGATWEGSMK